MTTIRDLAQLLRASLNAVPVDPIAVTARLVREGLVDGSRERADATQGAMILATVLAAPSPGSAVAALQALARARVAEALVSWSTGQAFEAVTWHQMPPAEREVAAGGPLMLLADAIDAYEHGIRLREYRVEVGGSGAELVVDYGTGTGRVDYLRFAASDGRPRPAVRQYREIDTEIISSLARALSDEPLHRAVSAEPHSLALH